MPSLKQLFSCLPSNRNTNTSTAQAGEPTAHTRLTASDTNIEPAPSERLQQSEPPLAAPPSSSASSRLATLAEGFPDAHVTDMERAYQHTLGRVQSLLPPQERTRALAALACVSEHFSAHADSRAYKQFIANTLFEIAGDRYTLDGLQEFLSEENADLSINTDKIKQVLDDFQFAARRRAQDPHMKWPCAVQQAVDEYARSLRADPGPFGDWLDHDPNPQRTIEALAKQQPPKLAERLCIVLAEEMHRALSDSRRLEHVLKTGFDPKVLPEPGCSRLLKLIDHLPTRTLFRLFKEAPNNGLASSVSANILNGLLPLSPPESSAPTRHLNLPLNDLNDYQTLQLKQHIKNMSLWRLEEYMQCSASNALTVLLASEYLSRAEGVARLIDWVDRLSLDQLPYWVNTLLVHLPQAADTELGALSRDQHHQLSDTFENNLRKSSDTSVLQWVQTWLPKLDATTINTALSERIDNSPPKNNPTQRLADIIHARLQAESKVWLQALFDFAQLAQSPKTHLLTVTPHEWTTTLFAKLAQAQKRDIFAKLWAFQTFSQESLPRKLKSLFYKLAQDETIFLEPFTPEMLNTFRQFTQSLSKTEHITQWPVNKAQITETLTNLRKPEDLKRLMFAAFESFFADQMAQPPEKSDSVLHLDRADPSATLLAHVLRTPNTIPRIAFRGEDLVVDQGGPLDEALMLTFEKCFDDEPLWENTSQGFVVPKPANTAEGDARWQQFGALLGLAALRCGTVGSRLSQSFFNRLHAALGYHLNHATQNDAGSVRNQLALKANCVELEISQATDKTLLMQLKLDPDCDKYQYSLYTWLCEPSDATRAALAKTLGCEDQDVLASDSNMREYLTCLGMAADISQALTNALGATIPIAKGLTAYSPELAARCLLVGPNIFKTIVNGADLSPRQTLLRAIESPHRVARNQHGRFSQADKAYGLLRNFIEDESISNEVLKKLLIFITGKQTLGYNAEIRAVPSDFPVIRSHTCFNELEIPKTFLASTLFSGKTKNEFRDHVTAVLEHHNGAFDMDERIPPDELFALMMARLMQEATAEH